MDEKVDAHCRTRENSTIDSLGSGNVGKPDGLECGCTGDTVLFRVSAGATAILMLRLKGD